VRQFLVLKTGVQVASFPTQREAEELVRALEQQGFAAERHEVVQVVLEEKPNAL
jgi:hypothetical protein